MQLLETVKEPPKIRVVVRKRPLNSKEQQGATDVCDILDESRMTVAEIKQKVDLTKYIDEHAFSFDNVFDSDQDNQAIYEATVLPLVVETFKGAKTSCFAYGQTGSGKTFTMMGPSDGSVPGLYLLAAYDVIDLLNSYTDLELYLSFFEIYCGKLQDLLNKRAEIVCREDNKHQVQFVNMVETKCSTAQDIMTALEKGTKLRASGATGANAESSRSHAIMTMTLKHYGKAYSKMSFIDLAGSERGQDVQHTDKQTKVDGAEINKSLLALKECIRALDQDKKHTPFRGSKLTQVLKDSFVGNSKTTMIANISPASTSCEHTLNTLRYADRVKELKKDASGKVAISQEERKQKEMMLARDNKNSKQVAVDQKTGKRIEAFKGPAGPTLRGGPTPAAPTPAQPRLESKAASAQPQQSQQFQPSQQMNPRRQESNPLQQQQMQRPQTQQNQGRFQQQPPRRVFQQDPDQGEDYGQEEPSQVEDEQPQRDPYYDEEDDDAFNLDSRLDRHAGRGQQQRGDVGPPINVKNFDMDPGLNRSQTSYQKTGNSRLQQPTQPQRQKSPAPQQPRQPQGRLQQNAQQSVPVRNQNRMSAAPNEVSGLPRAMMVPDQQPQANRAGARGSMVPPSPKVGTGRQSTQLPQAQNNLFASVPKQSPAPATPAKMTMAQMREAKQQQKYAQQQPPAPAKPAAPTYKVIGSDVPTREQLIQKYGERYDLLNQDHEKIIETILEDEEKLTGSHRAHIDEAVIVVKDEMELLSGVDKPGSDVEDYALKLDKILLNKIIKITKMRDQLHSFYKNLKTEEVLSALYQELQEPAEQTMDTSDQQQYQDQYQEQPIDDYDQEQPLMEDDLLNDDEDLQDQLDDM